MMQDVQNIFMDKQALSTGAPATTLGLSSYDLWGGQTSLPADAIGNTINIDPGPGYPVRVDITATTALTSGTSVGTVEFDLIMADNAALTTNVVVLAKTSAIVVTTATLGYKWNIAAVPWTNVTKRYLGVQYVVGTEALTAGAVSASLVMDVQAALPLL